MSSVITYSTAERADVAGLLGAADRLTEDQQRALAQAREKSRTPQPDLDPRGVNEGLSVPDALEHLIAGHADSDAANGAGACYRALQCLIDVCSCDSEVLGVYSRPFTFFSALDDDLRRLGVGADLLPHARLFSGPPDEIPFPVPYPVDGRHIGMWPLDRAEPAADAYRTVLDRIDPEFSYDFLLLIGRLDVEHDAWKLSTQECDWYSQDTIFFSVTD
ncbi:hypothetical protein [Streptomyces sp. NPDC046925]|uniref:DUF7691 family protein n=1 Tax=Streptomyces sp. NPDC046925 TaxID=3155375 RepID=UPI0033EB3D16